MDTDSEETRESLCGYGGEGAQTEQLVLRGSGSLSSAVKKQQGDKARKCSEQVETLGECRLTVVQAANTSFYSK